MKVLHVTSYDRLGGAGIAAFRLHQALRKEGIDSWMLVRTKGSDDPFVAEIGSPKAQRLWSKAFSRRLAVRGRGWLGAKVTKLLGMEGCSFNILPTGLHKVLNASDADVIHFHWINNEMISIKEIAKIKKPLVWTLHDCWPFLGAEHHSGADYWKADDGGQRTEIRDQKEEPKTHSLKSKASIIFLKKKQKCWQHLTVHFVAPSCWMADQVRQSRLFANAPVTVIPNGLDTNVFKPMDKAECREKFDLPQDRNLILFGAYNPLEPNKGSDLLEKSLFEMPIKICNNTDLVVFGCDGDQNIAELKTYWMGVISSEREMAVLYNAGDVICVPSRIENLPTVIAEALACGIPSIGFKVGGIPDMIEHKVNGWLAEPYDTEDFCKGIQWFFEERDYSSFRSKAEMMFAGKAVAQQHNSVYRAAKSLTNIK